MNIENVANQKLGASIFQNDHVQLIIDTGNRTIDYDSSKPLKLYLSYKKGNSENFWITAAVDENHLYAQYLSEFAIKETFTEFTEAYIFGAIENVQGYAVNLVKNTEVPMETIYCSSEGYDIIK
jgi:hypothetical protein